MQFVGEEQGKEGWGSKLKGRKGELILIKDTGMLVVWIGRKEGGGSRGFRLFMVRFLAFHSSKMLTYPL